MKKSYKKIVGEQAIRIWKAVYKNKIYTERAHSWKWAEIVTDTRNVYFGSGDETSLLSFGPNIYMTIGLI